MTVGIPTRNRSGFVLRAIESALAQTYRDVEVVVSDNASTDDTVARVRAVRDARVVVLAQPENLGMVGNFNAVLKSATGELVLLLPDDDLLEPEAVQELSRPFYERVEGSEPGSIGVTWCQATLVDPDGKQLWVTDGGPALESPVSLLVNVFNGRRGPRSCGVMVRTIDALAVGGFNEERYGYLFDTANWGAIALRYDNVVCISHPLVRYTLHANSATSKSACRDWQRWAENMFEDFLGQLAGRGDAAAQKKLRSAHRNLMANITVTILIQSVGQRGSMPYVLREVLRSWRYFLTPFVAKRLVKDGWKIVRLRSN